MLTHEILGIVESWLNEFSVLVQRHTGDLYVTYSVAFPRSLTEKQKTTVRETFPPSTPVHEEL